MLRFLRTRALPPVHAHLSFSTKSPPTLPERARIALVGRTNIGKSTLFNRLTKTRGAIVHNVPGTTRDRRFAVGYLAGLDFDVIDTGGLADAPSGSLERGMLSQTERALHEADLILFLIDGREGVTEIDKHFARWLRKADPQAPIQLVANKLEGDATQWLSNIHDSFQLGMGEPLVISAEHGEGLTDLVPLLVPLVEGHAEALAVQKAALAAELPAGDTMDELENPRSIKLAIVGRPNVGKSTLLNKIVRDDRVLTGPEPGVTRDAVEVKWAFHNREITLVDTAGIRKFSKRDHSNQIENLSVRDTYDAISSAQVVCVVVDVSEKQLIHLDLTIAQRVLDEGRALVLVANKADLVDDAQAEIERIRGELDGSLAQVRGVPIVSISALEGKGIRNILPEVVAAHDRWDLRVTTGRLNRWMAAMDRHHPPPTVKGKTLKVKYITQVKARPPTFALFVNKADDVPESYRRFVFVRSFVRTVTVLRYM
ncbi:ribosome-associated GTPase EngA, variant [Aphanomyces astaci]|uniref:GTPase Der n=1 Tax=Aphanomyces astaci TaxID=112090 RepID=W4HA92_APHAT|nr:ribosome-associated GTPase EngA, variant [Aphanomyces astaci]ETV88950.1 ribosome-associated GTPase EngA, variant [Aphanomyces astaci]|eukprot:XP_009821350.1 ribosome-associated GTPase EngA, variant [Aphanomyces astaci]